jgi:hypothetical protein
MNAGALGCHEGFRIARERRAVRPAVTRRGVLEHNSAVGVSPPLLFNARKLDCGDLANQGFGGIGSIRPLGINLGDEGDCCGGAGISRAAIILAEVGRKRREPVLVILIRLAEQSVTAIPGRALKASVSRSFTIGVPDL